MRHWVRHLAALLTLAGGLACSSVDACAQAQGAGTLRHEGYVCADLEGARAVAAEMLNDAQGYDTVWDVVDAVRAEGHDCTHTLSGPLQVKVIATIEPIKGTTDPPLHIIEVRALKEKTNVFIIAALE